MQCLYHTIYARMILVSKDVPDKVIIYFVLEIAFLQFYLYLLRDSTHKAVLVWNDTFAKEFIN